MDSHGRQLTALARSDDLRQVPPNNDAPPGLCPDVGCIDLEHHMRTAAETVQRCLRSGPKDDRVTRDAVVDREHVRLTLVDEADAPDDGSRQQSPAHSFVEIVDPDDWRAAYRRGCVCVWLFMTVGAHRCDHVVMVAAAPASSARVQGPNDKSATGPCRPVPRDD